MERSATLLSDSEKGNSPLTVEQYRVWFLSQMERNSTQFNINLAYKIFGDLDYTILESSLNLIVERHDTLRTVFRSNGNEPEQVVMEDLWIPINIIKPNIVEIEDQAIELQALELLEKEIEKPFSLENGPLINLTIYELNSNERLLLFKIHHIIADFQSLETLIKELGYNYNLKLKGEEYNLPPLKIQYTDYVRKQQENIKSGVYQKQLNYWKTKLEGELPILRMPLDKPRGVALTQSGKRMRIVIPSNLTLQLKSLSRKSGVTMFITMLSAYLTLLKKYSGQDDLCVGTSVSTRSNSDLEEIIGLLANNIVLRSNLEGNPSFGELLKRTRKVAFGAFANKEIPYEKLIEELQTDRDMSHNPFFQTMLTYLVANDEVKQPFQG